MKAVLRYIEHWSEMDRSVGSVVQKIAFVATSFIRLECKDCTDIRMSYDPQCVSLKRSRSLSSSRNLPSSRGGGKLRDKHKGRLRYGSVNTYKSTKS